MIQQQQPQANIPLPPQLDNIGAAFPNPEWQYWIPNAITLVQAALSPLLASISDVFGARKLLMVGLSTIAFVGAAIAPGSGDIYRLIGASLMIGFGLGAATLGYAVPSEIVPRRWRPCTLFCCSSARYRWGEKAQAQAQAVQADHRPLENIVFQALINVAAGLGAVTGPLVSELRARIVCKFQMH
jgi:MFS family permease